jgi:hypothetical protein
MSASELIQELQRLPANEAQKVYEYLFSNESELDRIFAAFDRLPRSANLSEEEILALPRARSARQ